MFERGQPLPLALASDDPCQDVKHRNTARKDGANTCIGHFLAITRGSACHNILRPQGRGEANLQHKDKQEGQGMCCVSALGWILTCHPIIRNISLVKAPSCCDAVFSAAIRNRIVSKTEYQSTRYSVHEGLQR
jgi:hypothetical protein